LGLQFLGTVVIVFRFLIVAAQSEKKAKPHNGRDSVSLSLPFAFALSRASSL
jgi:hypothetical protein